MKKAQASGRLKLIGKESVNGRDTYHLQCRTPENLAQFALTPPAGFTRIANPNS